MRAEATKFVLNPNRSTVLKSKPAGVSVLLLMLLLAPAAVLLLATAAPVGAISTPPVTVACSPNPVTLGSATTCTATESAGTGSGDSVGWSSTDSGGVFSPTSCFLSGSPVSCSVGYTPSALGSQTITAMCGNEIGCATGTGTLDVNPATYSVTFQQSGIPTTGVTWGVMVNSVHHTGTGASIIVSGLSGTVAYSYDSPVSGGPGVEYVCSSGCSGSVSGAGTVSATYTTQYSVTYQATGCPLTVTVPSQWVASGGSATGVFPSPVTDSDTQCVFVSDNRPETITAPTVITGTYQAQFLLTVSSPYGSPSGTGWYNAGSPAGFSVSTPVSGAPGTQYALSAWAGTGAGSYSGSNNPGSVTMNNPITETASWVTQYSVAYEAVGCPLAVTVPTEWVNSGSSATGVFPSPVTDGGTQCVFVSDNRPETITGPTTVTGTYQTQYYLTVSSPYGSPVGAGWYNAGDTPSFSVTTPASGGPGTRYLFVVWTGSGTGSYSGSSNPGSVTMSNPITEAASWTTQYSVSFAVSPPGSGTTGPSGTNLWEDAGPLAISASANPGYGFGSWAAAGSITFASPTSSGTTATISGPGTITADFGLATTMTVACIPPTIPVGATAVCTAYVSGSGPVPTGQVTFTPSYPGKVTFLSPATCTLVSASCSVTVLGATPGSLLMDAVYGGDSSYGGSSGAAGLNVYAAGNPEVGTFGQCSDTAPPSHISVILSTASAGAEIFTTNLGNLASGTTGLVTPGYYEVEVTGVSNGNAWICIYSSQVTGNSVMKYYYGGWQQAYPFTVSAGKWIGGLVPIAALSHEDLVTFGVPIDPPPANPLVFHTSSIVFNPPRALLRMRVM